VGNKKIKTLYVIFFVAFVLCLFAYPSYSKTSNFKIKGNLTQNYSVPTAEIERMFRSKLNLGNSVIYTKVPRGLVVSIDSTVFFNLGQDELLEQSKSVLYQIALILKTLNNQCIVEGNTDVDSWEVSNYQYNWELSTVRAGKIVDYLIKVEKVNPHRINAIGFGEMMPFYDNVNYRQNMNKRIDFVIINYEKQKPLS
jgi:ompA/motB domain protein